MRHVTVLILFMFGPQFNAPLKQEIIYRAGLQRLHKCEVLKHIVAFNSIFKIQDPFIFRRITIENIKKEPKMTPTLI